MSIQTPSFKALSIHLTGQRKCILYVSSNACLQLFSTAESCEMECLCLRAALFFLLPGCCLYAQPFFSCHLSIFRTDVVGVRVFKIQRMCHSLNMYIVGSELKPRRRLKEVTRCLQTNCSITGSAAGAESEH